MVRRQVAGAQLLRLAEVLLRVALVAAFAFHRRQAGQHLDAGRGVFAVGLVVPRPGVGEPVARCRAHSGGVFGGCQVRLGGQHPGRQPAVHRGQFADQAVVELGRPAVVAHPVQHRRVGGRRRDRAFVVRAVQAFLRGVGEAGPGAGRVRVAEGDQDPGVQGRGQRQVG
jgi:hypothetical protein